MSKYLWGRKEFPASTALLPQKILANDIVDRFEWFFICGHTDEDAAAMFLATGTDPEIISELYGKEACLKAIATIQQQSQ